MAFRLANKTRLKPKKIKLRTVSPEEYIRLLVSISGKTEQKRVEQLVEISAAEASIEIGQDTRGAMLEETEIERIVEEGETRAEVENVGMSIEDAIRRIQERHTVPEGKGYGKSTSRIISLKNMLKKIEVMFASLFRRS